jgi:DNA-binding transcriptional MocR family regulator
MNLRTKGLINLLRGWPNPNLLPPEALKVASGKVLSDRSIAVPSLQYGPDEGYGPLREEIARWLTSFYATKTPIKVDRICITGGASQNLACILQTFTDPVYTRNVWMVAPTYYLACRIFEDSGFAGRLRSVPEDEGGINIDYLSEHIAQSEKEALADGNTDPVRQRLSSLHARMLKQVVRDRN